MSLERNNRCETCGERWARLRLPLALAVLGLGAFAIDLPVSSRALAGQCPKDLNRLLNLAEVFAHGYGVILILATVFTLDVAARTRWARILMATFFTGALSNAAKLLIARTRPHSFDFSGEVSDTFGSWLPMVSVDSAQRSFPSGHTMMAAALATTLVWLYPRGKYLFPILAVLAAGQRVASGNHYVSDVLFGGALGCLFASLFLRSRWLDRFEKKQADDSSQRL